MTRRCRWVFTVRAFPPAAARLVLLCSCWFVAAVGLSACVLLPRPLLQVPLQTSCRPRADPPPPRPATCRQKHAKQLTAGPDPKLLITDGRERTDGCGTTGQVRVWRSHGLASLCAVPPTGARCTPCPSDARCGPPALCRPAPTLPTGPQHAGVLEAQPQERTVLWQPEGRGALFRCGVLHADGWVAMCLTGRADCAAACTNFLPSCRPQWPSLVCCAVCSSRLQLACHVPPTLQMPSWRPRFRALPRPSITAARASRGSCSPPPQPRPPAAQLAAPPAAQSQQAAAGEVQREAARLGRDPRGGERRRWRQRQAARAATTS